MALSGGAKWALYLLMAKHSDTPDGKSAFRTEVENNGTPGNYKPAFLAAAQSLDNTITANDIVGNIPDLSAPTLRTALGMGGLYPGQAGPCPDGGNGTAIYKALAGNIQ